MVQGGRELGSPLWIVRRHHSVKDMMVENWCPILKKRTKDTDSEFGTLEKLDETLRENVNAVEWLDQLYRLLKDDDLEKSIRECHIVLDQAGYLDKLSNLYRDNDIDDELKAIGDDALDLGIRGQLRDTRLDSLANEVGKGERGNKEVLLEMADKLHELGSEGTLGEKFTQASPRLLALARFQPAMGSFDEVSCVLNKAR